MVRGSALLVSKVEKSHKMWWKKSFPREKGEKVESFFTAGPGPFLKKVCWKAKKMLDRRG